STSTTAHIYRSGRTYPTGHSGCYPASWGYRSSWPLCAVDPHHTLQRLDPKHSSSTRPSGHLPGQASGAGQHHPVLLNVRSAAACLHRQVPAAALGIPVTGAHDDASIDHTSTFRTSHLHALILPSKTPNITGLHHPNHSRRRKGAHPPEWRVYPLLHQYLSTLVSSDTLSGAFR